MRRIVYADSFVDEAMAIADYIELKFGRRRADAFIADLDRFCSMVAVSPGLGRRNHGYSTTLRGVIFGLNWVFFDFDAADIRFVHIVDGRRERAAIKF